MDGYLMEIWWLCGGYFFFYGCYWVSRWISIREMRWICGGYFFSYGNSECWISRWMGASGKSNLVWLPPALICPLGKPEINLDEARNDSFFHPATPAMFIAIAATIMIMVALMVATQYGN